MENLPVKPVWHSRSFWAGVITIAIGLLQAAGVDKAVTDFLNVNTEVLTGLALSIVGSWGVWGTVTRKSALAFNKQQKPTEPPQ